MLAAQPGMDLLWGCALLAFENRSYAIPRLIADQNHSIFWGARKGTVGQISPTLGVLLD